MVQQRVVTRTILFGWLQLPAGIPDHLQTPRR